MLLLSVLRDGELRKSGMSIAVLVALVAFGAAGEAFIPARVHDLADTLDSSYDSTYKTLKHLSQLGYVELSKARQRLFLRLVWPQTTPAKTRRTRKG